MLNGELCSETDFCLRHDMENKKRWAAFLRQCVGRPIVTPIVIYSAGRATHNQTTIILLVLLANPSLRYCPRCVCVLVIVNAQLITLATTSSQAEVNYHQRRACNRLPPHKNSPSYPVASTRFDTTVGLLVLVMVLTVTT